MQAVVKCNNRECEQIFNIDNVSMRDLEKRISEQECPECGELGDCYIIEFQENLF